MSAPLITRMSPLARALPQRILVANNDEVAMRQMSKRLEGLGFNVSCAKNGREALALLEQEWFPLFITALQVPAMGGRELIQAIRNGQSVDDTYVILLTASHDGSDYELGYAAGVDDYLSHKAPQSELTVRLQSGFNTLAMRRNVAHVQEMLTSSLQLDQKTGAFSAAEIWVRLHGEVRRAHLYGRDFALLTMEVLLDRKFDATPDTATLRAFVQVIKKTVRAEVDLVGCMQTPRGAGFMLLLPECKPDGTLAVKQRLTRSLQPFIGLDADPRLKITMGIASLEIDGTATGATDAPTLLKRANDVRDGQEPLSTGTAGR